MTKGSHEGKWIAGGLSLALLLMGGVSFVSYQNATRLIASANQVKQTHQVLKALTDVVVTLTDAESGRRGYILLEDEEELERYNLAIQAIDAKITQLRQLLADASDQQERLKRLDSLIASRLTLFQQLTNLYQTNKSLSDRGMLIAQTKQNRQEILQLVAQIQAEEEQLLQIQIGQSQSGFQSRMLIEILGTFLTFVVLLTLYALLYYQWLSVSKQRCSNGF